MDVVGLRTRDHEMTVETEPVGRGRGHARVIALHAAAGDEDVGVEPQRFRGEQFELAGLVAAEGETREVVPFDEVLADRRAQR